MVTAKGHSAQQLLGRWNDKYESI